MLARLPLSGSLASYRGVISRSTISSRWSPETIRKLSKPAEDINVQDGIKDGQRISSIDFRYIDQDLWKARNAKLMDGVDYSNITKTREAIKIFAIHHLLSGQTTEQLVEDDIFSFLPEAEKEIFLEQLLHLMQEKEISIPLWIAWVNITAHCKTWFECVSQLQKASADDDSILDNTLLWPHFIAIRAISLVQNSTDALEAAQMIFSLATYVPIRNIQHLRNIFQCINALNALIHQHFKAKALSGMIAALLIEVGEILTSSNDNAEYMAEFNEFLFRQIDIMTSIKGTGMKISTLLHEYDELSRTSVGSDIFRMAILGIRPKSKVSLAEVEWEDIDWQIMPGKAKANNIDAESIYLILQNLAINGRFGEGLELAFCRAIEFLIDKPNQYNFRQKFWRIDTLARKAVENEQINKDVIQNLDIVEAISIGRPYSVWSTLNKIGNQQGLFPLQLRFGVIRMLARDKTISVDDLIQFVDIFIEQQGSSSQASQQLKELYSNLFEELCRRSRLTIEEVRTIWDDMESRNVDVDISIILPFSRILLALNRPKVVLNLLRKHAGIESMGILPSQEEETNKITSLPVISRLAMIATTEAGMHLDTFTIFNDLQIKYGVHPDQGHLSVLLYSATECMQQISNHGSGTYLTILQRIVGVNSKDGSYSNRDHSPWNGLSPGIRARFIFKQLLFDRHPSLRNVKSALEELKEDNKYEDIPHDPLFNYSVEFSRKLLHKNNWNGRRSKESHFDLTKQNQLGFTQEVFSQYLKLLPYIIGETDENGNVVSETEPFLIISWMKHLQVRPTFDTMCLICTFLEGYTSPFAEAMDSWIGKNKRKDKEDSAAGILHDWFKTWVWKDRIPKNAEILQYFRNEMDKEGKSCFDMHGSFLK